MKSESLFSINRSGGGFSAASHTHGLNGKKCHHPARSVDGSGYHQSTNSNPFRRHCLRLMADSDQPATSDWQRHVTAAAATTASRFCRRFIISLLPKPIILPVIYANEQQLVDEIIMKNAVQTSARPDSDSVHSLQRKINLFSISFSIEKLEQIKLIDRKCIDFDACFVINIFSIQNYFYSDTAEYKKTTKPSRSGVWLVNNRRPRC